MTIQEHALDSKSCTENLLSKNNIKDYLIITFGLVVIIALYYILIGLATGRQPSGGPPGRQDGPGAGFGTFDSWPLWGVLSVPSLFELIIAFTIITTFGLIITYLYRKRGVRSSIYVIVLIGVLLIIATNLIHGLQIGIEQTMGAGEIFTDALRINNIIDFISNFEALQPTLTLHAQTQPPGAVLAIYLLYLVFNSQILVAIGLCAVSAIGSAFFLRGIVRQLFDDDHARYATFLYLLLPAVQVYYLANIYAIVATLVLGFVYFYLHTDRRVAAVGTFLSLFLLTFITFLSVFMVFFLFVYEILKANSELKSQGIRELLKVTLKSIQYPIILTLCVGAVYGLLLVTLGFNYINAFLYASSLENPNGFMLLSNPVQYFTTRIQDILDIVIFFGPVLSVLAYRGITILQKEATENPDSSKKYNLVIASLIALGLLFLTGAPKKGETARICMFILPFLLIPVITYIQKTNMSRRNKTILLALVFGQAVLLQLLGIWIW